MVPCLFFVPSRQTSFVVEEAAEAAVFLGGFRAQTHPERASVHSHSLPRRPVRPPRQVFPFAHLHDALDSARDLSRPIDIVPLVVARSHQAYQGLPVRSRCEASRIPPPPMSTTLSGEATTLREATGSHFLQPIATAPIDYRRSEVPVDGTLNPMHALSYGDRLWIPRTEHFDLVAVLDHPAKYRIL